MLVKGKIGGPSVNLLLLALPGLDLGPSLREICAANRTDEKQIVIQAGLLKEGLCSVQDESAGHFILTLIWMRVKLWLPLKKEVDFHKYIFS
ncbi:uncharacterized protein LOC126706419 isoform X4 [Quercus robur]|uniref:uncharacterized protein LOC126706419 isoform X4 n=1 Tax=Quercus robur TaxID=38942 RepID=UPI0021618E87|nr:uncharacterized protein LOC126706419 isoform X4 [Quercus robur]